ncbi:MAG: nuclear transport factor 2 family protein [Candidatus Eremiobacteraeota bacterium]|nr:nuclear transport factor 2 family protein [Candidatus Eremiobacteraeota bacterium]
MVAAWIARDAASAAACFAPKGVYRERAGEPIAGTDALCRHFAAFFSAAGTWDFHIDEVIERGDRAAVFYRFRTKGADDAWSERAGCAAVWMRDGLIDLWREYTG